MPSLPLAAAQAGHLALGGHLVVNRLGYGTMQLPGPGVWGDPKDPEGAIRVLRRAVDLGVNFIDTADSYGPFVAEELVARALHPYNGVTVATKGGLLRVGPSLGLWPVLGRPDYLRQCVEMSLRRLRTERIDLYQLHRIDPEVPLEDQVGVLARLQQEGKIAHIGLSEVSVAQLVRARQVAAIVSVQNLYNVARRGAEDLLEYAEGNGIAFIPWSPLGSGALVRDTAPVSDIAARLEASPSQIVLAWLLRRSPVMLPIPGTSSLAHLEENVAATGVTLTDKDMAALAATAGHRP